MSGWLHELPVLWIAVIAVCGVALVVAVIQRVVTRLATGERAAAMQAISPGLLPPLGIVFALIVGFLAAGVWGDTDKAKDAVSTEASALRSVVLLSAQLPAPAGAQLRGLVRRQIDDAVHREWPAMAKQDATLAAVPAALVQAQDVALAFRPRTPGQAEAQRELAASLQQALDARRQRIIVSDSHVNAVKWVGLLVLAAVMLIAIACVHSTNPRTALLAMTLFGAAVTVVVVMLLAQDEPFTGHLAQSPALLQQVMPRS